MEEEKYKYQTYKLLLHVSLVVNYLVQREMLWLTYFGKHTVKFTRAKRIKNIMTVIVSLFKYL